MNGSGRGQGGTGRGRMGGPLAGGIGGQCRCPSCGYTEPHRRGEPCADGKCPKCGASLVRN